MELKDTIERELESWIADEGDVDAVADRLKADTELGYRKAGPIGLKERIAAEIEGQICEILPASWDYVLDVEVVCEPTDPENVGDYPYAQLEGVALEVRSPGGLYAEYRWAVEVRDGKTWIPWDRELAAVPRFDEFRVVRTEGWATV